MSLKHIKMTSKKYYKRHNKKLIYLCLIFIAQTCTIQFFPLYLKHLNLSAIEVGIIRACQTWISVLMLPLWFSIAKQTKSTRWKKFVMSVFLTLTIIIYLCLSFIPLSNKTQNVTHCYYSSVFPTRKGMVSSFHEENMNNISSKAEVSPTAYLDKKLNHTLTIKTVSNKLDKHVMKISNSSSPISIEKSQDSFRDTNNSTGKKVSPNEINRIGWNKEKIDTSKKPLITNRPNFRFPTENFTNTRENKVILGKNMHNLEHRPVNVSNNNTITIKGDIQYSSPGHIFFPKTGKLFNLSRANNSNIHGKQNLLPRIQSNIHKDVYNITNLFKKKSNDNIYRVPSHYDSNNTDTENVLIPKSSVKKIGENNETKSDSEKKPNKGKSIGTNVLKIQANQHNSNFEKNGNKQNNILHHKNISQRWRVHNMTKNHLTRLHNMTKKNFMETLNRNLHSHSHYPEIENQSSESQVFITHNDWESRIKHRYERSVKNKRNHRLKRHHKFEFHHVFNHGSKLNNEDNNEGFKSSDDHVMPNRLYEERHEEEKTIKNHTIIRRLLSLEQPQFQIRNSKRTTDFEVQKVHLNHWLNKEKLSSELRKLFMQKKVEYIFSMTYGVILLVSVLCEVFSRAVEIASNQIVNRDESPTYNGFQYHFSIKADSQQIWKLISWGFLGCPLLALLVVMTKCSYQPRIFLLLPCLLTIIAVLTVWFCLKIPDSIWEWKLKDYEEELTQQDTIRLAKFGYYISILVAGFAMACNLEYILWYMDTLDNFTYNYQILYCGYVAVGAIFQAVTKSWLLKKQMKVPAISQDCMNADVDIARGDGFWSIGPILLGLHFLVASLLQPAWCLLLLGCLQGMSAAFLVSAKISIWWAAGYGLGSLFGGFMVELYSADWLFWIMAGSMFVWSAVITLCGGLLKFIGNNDRGRASYSQLLLPEGDSDNEEIIVEEEEEEDKEQEEECGGDDDWLEKALRKDEQLEAQRRRIMSCPT